MSRKRMNFNLLFIFVFALSIVTGCSRGKESKVTPKIGFEANIKEIQDIVDNREREVYWETKYQSVVTLKKLKDKRTEDTFLKILERKEPVRLHKDSDLPGVMSPLNMLKAVAMESLYETGGKKYLEVFYKIYKETDERILREMAKKYILSLSGRLPK